MIRYVSKFEDIVASVLLVALCMVVSLQVICRYALVHPLSWTEELASLLFVWMTLLGASIALREGQHFAVELLQRKLPPKIRRGVRCLVALLVLIFSVCLIYFGAQYAWENRMVRTPTLDLPQCVPYGAIPFTGFLMLLHAWRSLVHPIERGAASQ